MSAHGKLDEIRQQAGLEARAEAGDLQKIRMRYKSAGPKIAQFHASEAFVRGIRGPIRGGKSVACVWEIIERATRQAPFNGVRYSRWAVVRNDYPTLKSTTIKTWLEWMPEVIAPIVWGAPITARAVLPLADGTTMDLEVMFVSYDRPEHVKKVLSMELTGAWLNEARELGKHVLDNVSGRVGSFPPKRMGGATWSGVIMDTNSPDDDHWWYKLFEVIKPEGFRQFVQPPVLLDDSTDKLGMRMVPNPRAENVQNMELGYGYWQRLLPGKTNNWIKVYIKGEYGVVEGGYPVYPEYNDATHCAEEDLEVYPGLPLIIGMDMALQPAAVFVQFSPTGQARIVDELVTMIGHAEEYGLEYMGLLKGMGLRQFLREALKPHLMNHYRGMGIVVVGDPSGNARADTDERTCFDILAEEGFEAKPAHSNAFAVRRDAVVKYLQQMVEGGPGFLLSPKCKVLRKGFIAGYRMHRVQVAGYDYFRGEPVDNQFTHPHDGLQYALLGAVPSAPVSGPGAKRAARRPIKRVKSSAWT